MKTIVELTAIVLLLILVSALADGSLNEGQEDVRRKKEQSAATALAVEQRGVDATPLDPGREESSKERSPLLEKDFDSHAVHRRAQARKRTMKFRGRVWLDGNCNSKRDPGENGVIGAKVEIVRVAPLPEETVATPAINQGGGGLGIAAGTWSARIPSRVGHKYKVKVTHNLDGDFVYSLKRADSDVDFLGESDVFTVMKRNPVNSHRVNAGVCSRGSFVGRLIGGRVWIDTNRNGIIDPNENGVPDAQIEIWRTKPNGQSVKAKGPFRVDSAGRWHANIRNQPGRYFVKVLNNLGPSFKYCRKGGDNDVDSNGNSDLITLRNRRYRIDAGVCRKKVLIYGCVWYDQDRDSMQDNNEKGVAGAEVEVWRKKRNGQHVKVRGPVMVNSRGKYYIKFGNIKGGQHYVIVRHNKVGYVYTLQRRDSDVDLEGHSDFVPVAYGGKYEVKAGIVQDDKAPAPSPLPTEAPVSSPKPIASPFVLPSEAPTHMPLYRTR